MTDYKDAKAEAKATKARAKAMRPWFKKKRFILGGLLVIVVIAVAASSSGTSTDTTNAGNNASNGVNSDFSTNDEHPPADDVELLSCNKTVIDTVEYELQVTNHSSKASDYTITMSLEDDSGAKVGDGFASTQNVDPGQVAKVKGVGSLETDGPFKCLVEEVERFAS